MSGSSTPNIVKGIGLGLGSAAGGLVGGLVGQKSASDMFNGLSQMPTPNAPPAAPTTQNATMASQDQQLQNEIQLRASRTLFSNMGGGLLDQATPASRILLGGN